MKKVIDISKLPKENIFKVPVGYFDTLPVAIQQRVDLEQKPEVSFGNKQHFSIPANYFDTLSSRIINRIAASEKQVISLESLEKVNVFKVPDTYFNDLGQNIQANVWIEGLEKKNVFTVPVDYFDTLSDKIIERTQEPKATKTIQVNWWQRGKVMWAAAASIVLIVGLGFSIPQFSQSESEAAFEQLSKEEINSYLATQDLSYLEYEASAEKALPKEIESKILDDLEINKNDILEHLETQELEDI